MTICHHAKSRQRGVSLIEALITMVVLSVGLLSVAALQVRALQVSHNSYQRSIAVVQANDAVERLWAGICVLSDTTKFNQIQADWQNVHRNTKGMTWIAEGDAGLASDSGSRIDSEADSQFNIFVVWQDARLDIDSSGNPINTVFSYVTILPDPNSINCPP